MKTTRALLVLVAVLLAANLVVHLATPATAQPTNNARPWCVGVTEAYVPSGNPAEPFALGVVRSWSDGGVEYQRTVGTAQQVFTGWQPFPR